MAFNAFIASKLGAAKWYTSPRPRKSAGARLYLRPKVYAALRAEFDAASA